jgi:hypothetical protein
MTDDDRRLMVEIKAQARIAYESRPKVTNASIMAAVLGKDFPIVLRTRFTKKIKSVWRLRGMLCFFE